MKKRHRVFLYLYEATDKNRIALVSLVLLEALSSLVSVGFVMAMRDALDSAAKRDTSALKYGILSMTVLVVVGIAIRALIRRFYERVRASVENNLKGRLLHHILHGDYAQTQSIHSGEWSNRLSSDTAVVAGGIAEILPQLVGMSVKLLGAVAMIISMIPSVSYFLLPIGAASVAITWALRKYIKKHHKNVQEKDGEVRSYLGERLGALMIVRAFLAEDLVEAENSRKMKEHKRARMSRNFVSNVCNIGFSGLMNALYIISFIYCGFGIADGSVSYGTLLAVIQLIGQIQIPFASISGVVPQFYAMTASAERLLEAENFKKESLIERKTERDFSAIALENVSFSYPDGNRLTVFTGINLTINKGDYAALTGYSGCGKSTMFKLLLSLFEADDGKIEVQYKNGATKPLGVAHRPLFSYVPQGNQLMSGSIREAVIFAADDKSDEQRLARALYIACADGFVSELERGVDTILGEHGAGLSEGQLQRLAIARAVYADTPVLLLDEVTSSLDEQTEHMILHRLKSLTDKTVLIVTHRPAALEICNRIFEVTEEKITEIENKKDI